MKNAPGDFTPGHFHLYLLLFRRRSGLHMAYRSCGMMVMMMPVPSMPMVLVAMCVGRMDRVLDAVPSVHGVAMLAATDLAVRNGPVMPDRRAGADHRHGLGMPRSSRRRWFSGHGILPPAGQ